MVTLADVARLAGVTGATVSNVVNNTGTVSEKTRQKVEAAIKELGYHPNLIARGLVHGRTRIMALVINRLTNPFYAEFAEEVQLAAGAHGYYVLLYNARQPQPDAPQDALTRLYSLIDGLLVTESAVSSADMQRAAQYGIQVVLCGGLEQDDQARLLPWVAFDPIAASKLAADHLLQLGHRRCAVIAQTPFHDVRLDGFRTGLAAAGVELAPQFVQSPAQATINAGYVAAEALLALGSRPTGIFATNDLLAIGAIDAIIDHGMRVPGDISVVGFDDIHLAADVRPSLTTVALPRKEMAVNAVEVLMRHLDGLQDATTPEHRLVQPHLVIRQSTAPPIALVNTA